MIIEIDQQDIEIYNDLSNIEIEKALTGNIRDKWSMFKKLKGDTEFLEITYYVKYGIKEKFDIRSIIEEQYEMKTPYKIVVIERKQHIPLIDYRNEIDNREQLMDEVLQQLYDDSFDNQTEEQLEGYD